MEQELFWQKMRSVIREEVTLALRIYSTTKQVEKSYTIAEFCRHFQISKPTLYEWIKAGKITPVKIGRRVYFKRKDVDALLH